MHFRTFLAISSLACLLTIVLAPDSVRAHLGRRLRIEVLNDKLTLTGANTGMPDGLPDERPYEGAVHDHWTNYTIPALPEPMFATTFLPEFDLPASVASLQDHSLSLQLLAAFKWDNPQLDHHGVTAPQFEPLSPGEVIRIDGANNTFTNTDVLGSLLLLETIPVGGDPDIPINYTIGGHPQDVIHVLKFEMSANNLNGPTLVDPSDPFYVMISPDGMTPEEKLHHESLFLEQYLSSVSVPEPGVAVLLVAAGSAVGLLSIARRAPIRRK